ncbi:MAG TPA: M28 family metallopeptidase [Woeseiaceae bacterium]|nr:M28 family metallopeptidase [Woeseiaceae bacterium]
MAVLIGTFTAACGGQAPDEGPPAAEPSAAAAAAAAGADAAAGDAFAAIDAADFAEHVEVLASDEFQGRAPGGEGERNTVDYLTAEFRAAGLQPANGERYRQTVPLVSVTAEEVTPLEIGGGDETLSFRYQQEMMVWTKRYEEAESLADSEMVFVGYGIVAPEYDWNDYEGLDVEGKTVVMLVNDPGFASSDPELFNGRAMTYYGRWTYKYEEAARQGAAGALIVHETEAAGYPWLVVSGSWSGEQFGLDLGDGAPPRVAIEGWLTGEAARSVFSAAGVDFDEAVSAAAARDFEAQPLGLQASVAVENSLASMESPNVVGMLPGAEHPDEYIVYTAHWDHLGVARSVLEDRIYNGAVDNATGVAGMLEIAEAFAALEPGPARSVVFLAVTAEESGLLGSAWYASHPLFPLERTVANINLDAMSLVGPSHDITVIGYGNSELDDYAARAARAQGRHLEREPTPEKGFFYRSDHFSFAKRGVPALYLRGGVDHREKGMEYGLAWNRAWVSEHYHKVSDEYREDWDLRGVVEDVELLFAVGRALAGTRDWPNWAEGNEFRATRDASAAARDGR